MDAPLTKELSSQLFLPTIRGQLNDALCCRAGEILAESLKDVVPLYRSEIWAALLGINYDVADKYARIDKETWNPVDRQIEVDIPRSASF